MRVGRQLKLRYGLLRGCRMLAVAAVAAGIAWGYPAPLPRPEVQAAEFVAALLYVWLIAKLAAVVLGIPRPRPRCPRCAHKVVLTRELKSCPTCHVSFKDRVRREWRNTSPAQSPWITRPQTLRMGQLSRRHRSHA